MGSVYRNTRPPASQVKIKKNVFNNSKAYTPQDTSGLKTGQVIYAQDYIDLINRINAEYNWRKANQPEHGVTVFMESFALADESGLAVGKLIKADELKAMIEEINKLGPKGTFCDCNCNYCTCNCNYA